MRIAAKGIKSPQVHLSRAFRVAAAGTLQMEWERPHTQEYQDYGRRGRRVLPDAKQFRRRAFPPKQSFKLFKQLPYNEGTGSKTKRLCPQPEHSGVLRAVYAGLVPGGATSTRLQDYTNTRAVGMRDYYSATQG